MSNGNLQVIVCNECEALDHRSQAIYGQKKLILGKYDNHLMKDLTGIKNVEMGFI